MSQKGARKPRYYSYNRACLVVKKLGIKAWQTYRKRHIEDPKLPPDPAKHYEKKWVNWATFFGEKYPTLFEASAAVKSIGIKSFEQYRQHYKRDPRLPADPATHYQLEWSGWPLFVGKSQYAEKYPTFQEASIAAQSLGIKGKEEYEERYCEDPKLPSTPHKYYRGEWPKKKPWLHFLGKAIPYETYEEAREAVIFLGVRSRNDYIEKHKFDPKLPASPESVYKEKGWYGWDRFLGR